MIRIDAADVAGLTSAQTAAMLAQRLGRADDLSRARMPLPSALAQLLPAGVAAGSTIAHTGSTLPVQAMAAAVTAAGQHVALVAPTGRPDTAWSLLAVHELGGDLRRLAFSRVPTPVV